MISKRKYNVGGVVVEAPVSAEAVKLVRDDEIIALELPSLNVYVSADNGFISRAAQARQGGKPPERSGFFIPEQTKDMVRKMLSDANGWISYTMVAEKTGVSKHTVGRIAKEMGYVKGQGRGPRRVKPRRGRKPGPNPRPAKLRPYVVNTPQEQQQQVCVLRRMGASYADISWATGLNLEAISYIVKQHDLGGLRGSKLLKHERAVLEGPLPVEEAAESVAVKRERVGLPEQPADMLRTLAEVRRRRVDEIGSAS